MESLKCHRATLTQLYKYIDFRWKAHDARTLVNASQFGGEMRVFIVIKVHGLVVLARTMHLFVELFCPFLKYGSYSSGLISCQLRVTVLIVISAIISGY